MIAGPAVAAVAVVLLHDLVEDGPVAGGGGFLPPQVFGVLFVGVT